MCEAKQYENITCSMCSSQEGKNMHVLNAVKCRQCSYQSDRTVSISAIKEKACCSSVGEELWKKSSYNPN